ncbi:MAG: glycosyltransferase [Verrucomicrobia bacterium]|nr:glycosyltransferase [Verrucomicrobiota bacterium]
MRPSSKTAPRAPRHPARLTVVIPVLNESRTIRTVVKFALRQPEVAEVLVVDDGSIDGTPEVARSAGARIITSSLLGKGASLEDGLQAAATEWVLFLDGDLSGLCKDLIVRMVQPLKAGTADFIKARFERRAGRVTVLTARPLLRTYFPELAGFSQPLGGIVAARADLLRRLRFENDYGVDVGLLIDAHGAGAQLAEVDIGSIAHRSHSLEALGEMATQVARTILERASEWGRLRWSYLRASRERDRIRRTDFRHSLGMMNRVEALALFDMDGTLLQGRFAVELARHTDRLPLLEPLLDSPELDPLERSRRIGAVFAGIPKSVFERVAREIPLTAGAVETVVGLRKAGFLVGVVTDSYRIAAETVRRRVFGDFVISHTMKFRNDKAVGRIAFSPAMRRHAAGCREHRLCKWNALRHLLDEVGKPPPRVLAVGDSDNDVCLLRAADLSVAFEPKSAATRAAARHVVLGDLRGVLRHIG